MKKTSNESYNRIIEYIKTSPDIDSERKRILISYATQLYVNNIENVEKESMEEVLNAIRVLNETLKNSDDTSIVTKRVEDELKIFEMINSYYEAGENNLSDISYELDRLYMATDLGVRKNSSLSYNLQKQKVDKRNL